MSLCYLFQLPTSVKTTPGHAHDFTRDPELFDKYSCAMFAFRKIDGVVVRLQKSVGLIVEVAHWVSRLAVEERLAKIVQRLGGVCVMLLTPIKDILFLRGGPSVSSAPGAR